jgi:hypothetical protein
MSFDYLINKFPGEKPALEELGKLVGGAPSELTFEYLAAKVRTT